MANKLKLTRDQLASFLKDAEQIKQFEQLFSLADSIAPDVVNEISINAGSAQASANDALAQIQRLADIVGLLATEPAQQHDNFVVADYIDTNTLAPTPNGKPGRAYWDDGAGSLVVGLKGGNVTYIDGQQEYALCYNDSGVALTKGQVVYISGAQGNRVAVKLAQGNNDANSAHTIGFVAESIAAGAEGWVHSAGPIYKINTFGYTAGDTVYLSPTVAGAWTTTRPSAPDHTVILGFIERVHASVGSIYVKVDNGYELDELHNVKITSVANNNLLQYDSAGPFWKNVLPSTVTVGTATNLSGGLAGSMPYQTAASTTTMLGIGAANRILTSTGSAPQWSNTLSDLVSIAASGNITGTSLTIHPTLNGKIGSNDLTVQNASGAICAIGMSAAGSGFSTLATLNFVSNGSTVRGGISCAEDSGGAAGNIAFYTRNSSSTYAERVRISGSGNVGIGTATPDARLNVLDASAGGVVWNHFSNSSGVANSTVAISFDPGNNGLNIRDAQIRAINNGVNQIAMAFYTADGAAPVEAMRINSAGNVLVTGSGGLGYGTGSGGVVTQTTSRTTGVTLNKTNGAITLVSAAGSTAWQSFTVTNSTVAATDTVIVNQKSGTDLYMIHVTNVAAGSFRITFATTGGTTIEQPVFNFAIIKAVTS